jgi:MMP 1-O-methyltransferase
VPELAISTSARPEADVWEAMLATPGFLPEDEALGLYRAALAGARLGPVLEVGTYCGRSTLLLAAASRSEGTLTVTIDHHRGSEEHQRGEEFHDPAMVDAAGRFDTLPTFRTRLADAGLEEHVVAVVAASTAAARIWALPVGMVFIDGGHAEETAQRDYEGWSPHVVPGGLLVIHDVFEDPADGGRPPYNVYRRALDTGGFVERAATRSLRVLQRVAG